MDLQQINRWTILSLALASSVRGVTAPRRALQAKGIRKTIPAIAEGMKPPLDKWSATRHCYGGTGHPSDILNDATDGLGFHRSLGNSLLLTKTGEVFENSIELGFRLMFNDQPDEPLPSRFDREKSIAAIASNHHDWAIPLLDTYFQPELRRAAA